MMSRGHRAVVFCLALVIGCGGSDSGPGSDCTNANNPACGANNPCAAGTRRCGPDAVQQCRGDGSGWDPIANCQASQHCSQGQCAPSGCAAGQTMCTGDGRIQTCMTDVGGFSTPRACEVGMTCLGTGCVPQVCAANQLFCGDDMTVRQCDSVGASSTVVKACGALERCSTGSCQSFCAVAEARNTSIGCLFYGADLDNFSSDDPLELDFGVANDADISGNVKVEVRQGATWATVCQVTLMPHEAKMIGMTQNCAINQPTAQLYDRHLEDSGLIEGGAYRITSEVPVAVYQFNSDDAVRAYSSGGTVLLPVHVLARKYIASVLAQPNPADLTHNDDVAHGEIVVIGVHDDTHVTVTPTAPILAGIGVSATPAGQPVVYTVNEGTLLQLASTNQGDDLTGSVVEADKPIAVFGNNECGTVYPRTATAGRTYCDHTEEQLLPVQAWGKDFVGARVHPLEFAAGANDPTMWRVLASENGTQVTLAVPTGVTIDPTGPFTLDRGQFQDVHVSAPMLATAADFELHATKPVLVIEYMSGETVAVTAIPNEQLLSQYTFLVPDTFQSELTVVRPIGATVLFDNMAIADSLFTTSGGGFEVARVPLMRGSTGATPHKVQTTMGPDGRKPKVGIQVRGMDGDCSYGYMGGLSVSVINPVE